MLRTACVTAIIAQLGCPAPAESLTLSPVDAVFTRLGATDRIITGESTFLVECSETAGILRNATRHSLVILDELGRGTSTFDGYAIADAVLHHLAVQRGCRVMFATHYHALTLEHAGHSQVQLGHMAAAVQPAGPRAEERIVFQYTLAAGACPASHGLHVAALAGIPRHVCAVAGDVGSAFEARISRLFTRAAASAAADQSSAAHHACTAYMPCEHDGMCGSMADACPELTALSSQAAHAAADDRRHQADISLQNAAQSADDADDDDDLEAGMLLHNMQDVLRAFQRQAKLPKLGDLHAVAARVQRVLPALGIA